MGAQLIRADEARTPRPIWCVTPQNWREVASGLPAPALAFGETTGFKAEAGSLLVLPAAAARFWSRRLPVLLGLAAGLGALCVWLGLLLSFYANLPSGPCIVLLAGIAYLLSVCLGPVHGLLRRSSPPLPC